MFKNTIEALLAKKRSVPIPLGSKTFLRVLGKRGLAFLRVALFLNIQKSTTQLSSE